MGTMESQGFSEAGVSASEIFEDGGSRDHETRNAGSLLKPENRNRFSPCMSPLRLP